MNYFSLLLVEVHYSVKKITVYSMLRACWLKLQVMQTIINVNWIMFYYLDEVDTLDDVDIDDDVDTELEVDTL